MSKKQLAVKVVHAIILTVFTAGSIHLMVVSTASIVRQDLSLVNPVNVLGLQLLFPGLANSFSALVIGWLGLIGLGVLYLFLLIHYKRYLALISATSSYQRMQRMRQLTAELQGLLMELGHMRRSTLSKKSFKERLATMLAKYQDSESD